MPQFSPNSDTVTVEFVPDGDGCQITFIQEGVAIADEVRQTPPGVEGGSATGWGWMFVGLDAVLGDSGGG